MRSQLTRVANRAKREVIHRAAPVRHTVESRRARARAAYAPSLVALDPPHRALVEQYAREGAALTSWSGIGLPGTAALEPLLLQLADRLADRDPRGSHSVLLGRDETLEDIELWRWGLQPEVLDLVENCLGLPVRYFGPLVHRECADGRTVDTRQWHRDIEDQQMVKLLVWLNDVDAEGGPFTYVPREPSDVAARRLRYVGGFVGDDRFEAVVPRAQWRQVTGPRWTAALPDTPRIFHRAAPPRARDRYSVTYTWMTRRPLATVPAAPWRADQVRRCVAGLTPRQLACLPPAMATT